MITSKKSTTRIILFSILLFVLGLIFIFSIFTCLFAGDTKTATIFIAIFSIFGFFACLKLSYSIKWNWYLWSVLLASPMFGLGLLFAMGLLGGKDVNSDIFILVSSGLFVLLCGLIGGYVGMLKTRITKD